MDVFVFLSKPSNLWIVYLIDLLSIIVLEIPIVAQEKTAYIIINMKQTKFCFYNNLVPYQ